MKKKTLQQDVTRIQAVEKLIAEKMMLVNAVDFHVAMLAELWNIYADSGKAILCQNILTYCKVKNAFDQLPEKVDPVLLVSIKDSADNVEPYAYFKNGSIELIKK